MATRKYATVARLIAVLVLLSLLAVPASATPLSANPVTDGCVLKEIGVTQYISCWSGRELESRQVPEYLVGAGALIARRTGEVIWVPEVGQAVSVRQVDDDELIVRVSRPVRLFFFNIRLSHEVRLSLDIAGNVE